MTGIIPAPSEVVQAQFVDPNNLRHSERVEEAIKALAQEMRQAFNLADLAYLSFNATISGRVTGDLKVEFSVSCASFGGEVTGHSIQPAMIELLRRNGWDKRNLPKCLSYNGADKADEEEILF